MTSPFNLLITGGHGQIAQAIMAHPHASRFHLTACTHAQLDITDTASITTAIATFKPDVIINTAAYTAVDLAETHHVEAFQINAAGANYLAGACAQAAIPLIHLSTDYIFDGSKSSPYLEHDTPNPLNQYGLSKWQGEQAIREQCEAHYIIRVSGVFSRFGRNFYNTLQRLALENKPLRIIADQITCPTAAHDIAGMLLRLAREKNHFGTYHYCSTPAVSWHGFAEAVLQRSITAIKAAEYQTAATRPAYSVLDCHKIASTFGIKQPSWEQALCQLA